MKNLITNNCVKCGFFGSSSGTVQKATVAKTPHSKFAADDRHCISLHLGISAFQDLTVTKFVPLTASFLR